MTSSDLKIRIEKARSKVAKKEATIEKKKKWIGSGRYSESEIGWFQEDIKRLNCEILATLETLGKYEKQLAGEMERERAYATEVPASMKDMQQELEERWNEMDIKQRDRLKEKYKELGYKEFCRTFKASGYQAMFKKDDEIRKENAKAALNFVLDLFNRVRHITGTVDDWTGIRLSGGPALNGYVSGAEGKAKVETILAAGYNIQRLHVRVLVHSI